MYGARPQRVKPLQMRPGGIPLVGRKVISGVSRVLLHHHPVAGDLGDDGCRGYRQAGLVPPDNGLVRDSALRQWYGIDENEARGLRERLYCQQHSLPGGCDYPQGVHLCGGYDARRPGHIRLPDVPKEALSPSWGELLAVPDVGQPRRAEAGWDDGRPGHHRPCQRPASGLIYAGNEPITPVMKGRFFGEGGRRR